MKTNFLIIACLSLVSCTGGNLSFQSYSNSGSNSSSVKIQKVVTNYNNSCAISTTGNLYCWGDDREGAVTGGNTGLVRAPIEVLNGQNILDVKIGGNFACAKVASGSNNNLLCWGSTKSGELGVGNLTFGGYSKPVTPELNGQNVVDFSVGNNFACAIVGSINGNNSVYCWGDNSQYQMGLTLPSPSPSATPVGSYSTPQLVLGSDVQYVNIQSGYSSTCVLDSSHILWCWGEYSEGVAQGETFVGLIPQLVNSDVSQFWMNGDTVCYQDISNNFYCFGDDNNNEMPGIGGENNAIPYPTPVFVTTTSVNSFALGQGSGGCISYGANNSLACWGNGSVSNNTPADIGLNNIQSISMGRGRACASDYNGNLFCWGFNGEGEVGNGQSGIADSPIEMSNLVGNFASPSASGPLSTLFLNVGVPNNYYNNSYAVCGIELNSPQDLTCWFNQSAPADSGLSEITSFAGNTDHDCYVSNSTIYCMGDNSLGQLGSEALGYRSPAPVPWPSATPTQVVVGNYFSCGLDSTNDIYCWGDNTYNELAIYGMNHSFVPVQIAGFPASPNFIAASGNSICAYAPGEGLTNGVYCWGAPSNSNNIGNINNYGNNSLSSSPAPSATPTFVQYAPFGGAKKFAVTGDYTCLLIKDGNLYCWGDTPYTYRTFGSTAAIASSTSTEPTSLFTNILDIATPNQALCVIQSSGTGNNQVLCMGQNNMGQLGSSSSVYYTTIHQTLSVSLPSNFNPTHFADSTNVSAVCVMDDGGDTYCWGSDQNSDFGRTNAGYVQDPVQIQIH